MLLMCLACAAVAACSGEQDHKTDKRSPANSQPGKTAGDAEATELAAQIQPGRELLMVE